MAAATTAGTGVLLEGEAGKSGRHIDLHPVSPPFPFRLLSDPRTRGEAQPLPKAPTRTTHTRMNPVASRPPD